MFYQKKKKLTLNHWLSTWGTPIVFTTVRLLLIAPITARLFTSEGKSEERRNHAGNSWAVSVGGEQGSEGQGPVLFTSHPCPVMFVCLCVVCTMGELIHGNEPFTQRNHFSVGILSEMCCQLSNYPEQVSFCQEMQDVAFRRRAKCSHGKSVLAINNAWFGKLEMLLCYPKALY